VDILNEFLPEIPNNKKLIKNKEFDEI